GTRVSKYGGCLRVGTETRQLSMGKRNCCVPNCANSWRNSPEVKYHCLPKDKTLLKEYKRLIRNDNLKEFSANTRICGNHFPGGERMSRTQLPSIFPWKTPSKSRREIFKYELPAKRKKPSGDSRAEDNTSKVPAMAEVSTSDHAIVVQEIFSGSNVNCGVSENIPVIASVDAGKIQKVQTTSAETQTEKAEEIQRLENEKLKMQEEIDKLKKEVNKLKHTLEKEPQFDIDDFKDNDADIAFYTGFQNYDTMILCFNVWKEKAANLSYGNHQRVNFDSKTKDLANRYRVSVSTVSDICRTWIRFMKSELQPRCILWPSKEQIKCYMLPVFQQFYPELVSIIDCTEIRMESPSSLDNQSLCYSSYKAHTTMKGLIGITPNGVVSFASELYCGSISDPEIVEKSGFYDHLQKGDVVMADKGFLIKDQLAKVGARLAMPHFLSVKGQFNPQECECNKKIASLRIHVERYMERLKNWHFFDRVIPISCANIASDTWIVVACLSNFLPPIIS
ncbi:hypothetical protein ACROYT_G015005, partial [Oculina patagonica]